MELNPIAFILAILGAGLGWWVAGRMDPGFFWKVITTLTVGFVSYFIALK